MWDENRELLIRGAGQRLYIKTPLTLQSLMIAEGAILGNPDQTKLEITIADRLYVDGDSSIDVTGKGYLRGWAFRDDRTAQNGSAHGMTAGGDTTHGATASATAAASASYGDLGGEERGAATNAVYGSIAPPTDFGGGSAGFAVMRVKLLAMRARELSHTLPSMRPERSR